MNTKKKTVAVTGASGHVGGNLVRALLKKGYLVRVLIHQDRRALQGLDVMEVSGDICHLDSLKEAFKGADLVFHGAAKISLQLRDKGHMDKVNIIGSRNVVEACIECGVGRLVHFSSIHAFCSKSADKTIDETSTLMQSDRRAPYDCSKAAGEREVFHGIKKGLNAIVLNPTGIIGPFDYWPSHTGEVLILMATGRLPALIRGGFDWVDVRDVVDTAIYAAENAPSGSQYILSGHWISVEEMAQMVEEFTGIKKPWFVSPLWLARIGVPFTTAYARLRKKRPLYSTVSVMALNSHRSISHEKAAHELRYQPRPFRETIENTLVWLDQNGFLQK